MEINIKHLEQGSVVQVSGDVDMFNSPKLREAILELSLDHTKPKIVVNLEGVQYIDSSGVASLVEGLQVARQHKTRLFLTGLNEGPRHVLQLTRLLDVFDVKQSESDALGA